MRGVAVAADRLETHLTDHPAVDPMEAPEMAMETDHSGDDQVRPLLAARGAQEEVAVEEVAMTVTPTAC